MFLASHLQAPLLSFPPRSQVLEAYGVKVMPMVGAVLPGGARGALTGVLYEAQSWDDLAHAMFGGV